jgi:hypothetical protein
MPFPPEIDKRIRERFDNILAQAETLMRSQSDTRYYEVKTQLLSLMNYISPESDHFHRLRDEINRWSSVAYTLLLGYIKGLKVDYEAGMFDSLREMIEANVVSDYMGQAEQLLGEGIVGQYDHVPAAVLAGAVLEDALRRLCQRQAPMIDVQKPDGSPKTLDPLITDLQKDMLKSWAKIRNYAAHGEFTQFNRQDVESMVAGVKAFLADYL